jgi:hypothetical protein
MRFAAQRWKCSPDLAGGPERILVTMKVARSALHISLSLGERVGVRETIMAHATYIFRGGAGAMIVRSMGVSGGVRLETPSGVASPSRVGIQIDSLLNVTPEVFLAELEKFSRRFQDPAMEPALDHTGETRRLILRDVHYEQIERPTIAISAFEAAIFRQ